MSSKAFFDAQKMHKRGDLHDAIRIYEGLLKKNSQDYRSRIFYALACVQMGRSKDAFEAVNMVMAKEHHLELIDLNTAGVIYRKLGRLNEAESALNRAQKLAPENGGITSNIGLIKMAKGQYDEALNYFEIADKLMPEDISALLNIARIKIIHKNFDAADELLEEAKNRNPGHPELNLLQAELALTEADNEKAFKHLIASLKKLPANMEAWKTLNKIDPIFINIDLLEESVDAFVKTKPTSGRLISAVVGVLRKNLAWNNLEKIESLLNDSLISGRDNGIDPSAAFQLLASNISQLAHKNASSTSWKLLSDKFKNIRRPDPSELKGRKLRIGILSSDLRDHAIGYLVVSVLESHDKDKIELFAYSNSHDDEGKIRERMRIAFDRFVNVTNLNHEEIANKIREDKVDVLVDLNGMTAETMVPCFVYKPAPVTVTWLGMPGTLGASSDIDYVILDQVVCDERNINGFDEKVVLLPHSYQPNDSLKEVTEIPVVRTQYGLPDDAFVYCSFNQHYKYSPDTIKLWAEILNSNPISVLWILAPEVNLRPRLIHVFEKNKIDKNRIIFADKVSHKEHVSRIKLADLMLDNWPYNAHTTCSDSLRAGTPILTLPGETFASRVAASILKYSNLKNWIANTPEEYVQIATEASFLNRRQIANLKNEIRQTYWSSPMVESRNFAKNLEDFYFYAYDNCIRKKEHKNIIFTHEGIKPISPQLLTNSAIDNKSINEIDNKLISNIASINQELLIARNISDLLEFKKPLVIDIGCAKLEAPIGYEKFADDGLVSVLGFEISPDAFLDLDSSKVSNYTYIQAAIGDGEDHELNLCASPGMNSLLKPNHEILSIFPKFSKWAVVMETKKVNTKKLDDFDIAIKGKFLKIDVQGFEFNILKNSNSVLKNLSVIHIELSPTALYFNESSLFEVGHWLESKDYCLHSFPKIDKRGIKPWFNDAAPFAACNQIFQMDAVFIPKITTWSELSNERLEGLAFFMHIIYKSYDISARAFSILDSRDNGSRFIKYKEIVSKI